jgi:5-methylcytosine-specific restriction endonuclease McrA
VKPLTEYNRAHKACLENGAANNTPCWVCARAIRYRTDATVHYIARIADGGSALDPDNMVPVHKKCVPPTNSRRW